MTDILRAAAVIILAAAVVLLGIWYTSEQYSQVPPGNHAPVATVADCPYRPVMGLGPWSWHLEPVCN